MLNISVSKIAGLSVLSVSAIVGTIVYLADIHNGIRICVSSFLSLGAVLFSYAVYELIHLFVLHDFLPSAIAGFLFGIILIVVGHRLQLSAKISALLSSYWEHKEKKSEIDFKTYRKDAIHEWFWSQPNSILNQPISKTLIRIFIMIVVGIIGIYGLMNRGFSVFRIDAMYDKLFFSCLILYSILFFLTGFRRSAAPAFVAWTILLAFYFIHFYFFSANHPFARYLLMYKIVIGSLISFAVFIALYFLRNEFYYSNVQMYERNEECITVDLFVSEYAPIVDLDLVLIFSVGFADYHKRPKYFVRMLRGFVLRSLSFDSVFVGYKTQISNNEIHFYVYTKESSKDALIESLNQKVMKIGYQMTVLECVKDASWQMFEEQLYPNEKELCEIVSRSYIEELFKNGVSFDKEYEIGFFVNFKDKNDPADFERLVRFYGFRLNYASFDEANCLNDEYRYYGEYKIDSYITSRRIEYLNRLLLEKCENYGALYLGEWQIENDY